jgi:glycosyltransferase involved in cell wall biosynthesis
MISNDMKKISLSHPVGNTFVRGLLLGLNSNGLLHSFHTSVACFEGDFLDRLASLSPFKDFRRRMFSSEVRDKTITYPYKELGRMVAQKFHINKWLAHETGKFCIDSICQYIDKQVAVYLSYNKDITAIYAYEDCALNSFRQAKKTGAKCLYDLPIAYWEYGTKLMKEEAERLPEWAHTLGGGINDSDEKHARKIQELELADAVICPSKFVINSLPGWAKNKLIVESPFGTPDIINNSVSQKTKSNKLKVLFAGSMGQRKGLRDLFEAMKLLNNQNIELIVLGSLLAPMNFYKKQFPDFIYATTRPHHQVLELMQTCDIFCLPSIVEGRALVMQEAMSQGLPLIITPNTGGEDLIIEGETGFLVPIRSPYSIAEKINCFFENREIIPEMRRKAKEHAAFYTWNKYEEIIIKSIQNLI